MNTLQLQFLMLIFAGWVNRSQQNVIEYLHEENRVLREQLGGKRLLFTDAQRRLCVLKTHRRRGVHVQSRWAWAAGYAASRQTCR